jgi:acetyl-CoA acetyltransferase
MPARARISRTGQDEFACRRHKRAALRPATHNGKSNRRTFIAWPLWRRSHQVAAHKACLNSEPQL